MTNCTDCKDKTDGKCCHENATNGNDSQSKPADKYFEHINEGNC